MDWIVKAAWTGLGLVALTGCLTSVVGCGGGGATVPTVTFRPEAVEELQPATESQAAPAEQSADE